MNTFNETTQSQMLHLLVDGELESSLEPVVYSSLAENEELRNEMKELLYIRESVQSDIEAFTPPLEATQNVYNRLGFVLPQTTAITETANIASNHFVYFMKRALIPIATAIVASLFTFILINNSNDNANKEAQNQKNNTNNYSKSFSNQNITNQKQNIPVVTSGSEIDKGVTQNSAFANSNKKSSSHSNNTKISKNLKNNTENNDLATLNNKDEQDISNENIQKNNNNESLINLEIANLINSNNYQLPLFNNQQEPFNNRQFVVSSLVTTNNLTDYRDKNITLNIRGILATSFPTPSDASQANRISNFALGAYYKMGDNYRVGLEIGQEPFSERFASYQNGIKVSEWTQNPIMLWYSAGFQYETVPYNSLLGSQLYARQLVGTTEIGGFLSKTMLGLQYMTNSGFGISLGAEGSYLIYQNQNQIYTTKKIGFTYGMTYSF